MLIFVAFGIYDPEIFLKIQKQLYGIVGIDFDYDENLINMMRLAFVVAFIILSIFFFLIF